MKKNGFTLIELSIVLVIIGLIVGGVLVGQDLIKAAVIRAQISQIEKYNGAVNTFRGKYGYLPGDIPNPVATQYGFAVRGQYAGEGDGNGVIEGVDLDAAASNKGYDEGTGETTMVWVDLSTAKLISGSFVTASSSVTPGSPVTGTGIDLYVPQAKLGKGNYVAVWSGGVTGGNSMNYYNVAGSETIATNMVSHTALSVLEAYTIDKKIDDGLPQSGRVTATMLDGPPGWSKCCYGTNFGTAPYTTATPVDPTNCFDNNNVGGAVQNYSLAANANLNNCSITFQFQ